MTEEVLVHIEGGVGTIILNRPQFGNAIDDALGAALIRAIDLIANAPAVRAVLITGAGDKFCVGGDIVSMKAAGSSLAANMEKNLQPLHAAMLKLASLPIPIVSAVNGPVGGGGISLALCADLVLACASMKLRGGYSAIGLTPDLGASAFLTRRAGPARTKRILFLNEPLNAAECLACGIVDAVHPDAILGDEAKALVHRLADGATLSLGRIKQLIDGASTRSLEEQLECECDAMIASGRSEDGLEGIRAFLDKRSPCFRGR